MEVEKTNGKTIAKNTLVLYIRMIFIMIVNLYMSRVILETLGVDDYGIYNVVGGFVTLFTVLSGSLSNAISRFITIEIGRNNDEKLHKVFYTSVNVMILLALLILLLIEIVGIWFLNYKMQIPDSRLIAANWVLQCSAFTFVVNLINIPYNGCIIAHEKMTAFAYISILEVMLKLFSVLLLYFIKEDRLIFYGVMLFIVSVVIRVCYELYCSRHFKECKYRMRIDNGLLREIFSMASWNMFGAGAGVLNNHGVNLLINLFFGVTVNAARGIATQVNSAVSQFTTSFTTAINPQITKSYASGEIDKMNGLVFKGARFSFYLMLLISLPIIIETPIILKLWLKIVPEHTVVFSRLTIVCALISVLTTGLFTVSMATGKIMKYQIVIGSLALSIFVLSYISFYLGAPVEATYIIAVLIEILIMFARIIIVNKYVKFGVGEFFCKVIGNVLCVSITSSLLPIIMYTHVDESIFSFILVSVVTVGSTLLSVYFIGLYKDERVFLTTIIRKKINNLL